MNSSLKPFSLRHYRLLENLHIPLWIVKDACWMMHWKTAGAIMVIPTITMALVLVLSTRKSPQRLWPNLAVLCWISANSAWMLGEFFERGFTGPALCLFAAGILSMVVYLYIILPSAKPQQPKD